MFFLSSKCARLWVRVTLVTNQNNKNHGPEVQRWWWSDEKYKVNKIEGIPVLYEDNPS